VARFPTARWSSVPVHSRLDRPAPAPPWRFRDPLRRLGPANPRASSGDDTGHRATYGPDRIYVDLTIAPFRSGARSSARPGQCPAETGALWLAMESDAWERAALDTSAMPASPARSSPGRGQAAGNPLFDFSGVHWVLDEPGAGYLRARAACALVLGRFLAEGAPTRSGGSCPWSTTPRLTSWSTPAGVLPKLFPDVLGPRIRATATRVFYFGLPSRRIP